MLLMQNPIPPVILSVAKDLKKLGRDDVELPATMMQTLNKRTGVASEILRYAQDDRGTIGCWDGGGETSAVALFLRWET